VLAPYAEKLLNKDEKKLIVVHLLGTHMKYAYRYPESYDHFNDATGLPEAVSKNDDKVELINEYDNAILYNDHIVHALIQDLKSKTPPDAQSLLVYFSDHGEDVYDTAPHDFKGRNEGAPTYPMYAIPFFVWHSANWQLADKLADPAIGNRQYDNADFIYTWSDLLGLSYDGYRDEESLLSKHFAEDAILVGDPYGKKIDVLKGTVVNKSHHDAQLIGTLDASVVTAIVE
jgi:heptose-I-phosphate ethanolaminephosphotransferase